MANRIWAEVYTPAGERLGVVNLVSAGISYRLDGAGELNLQASTTDPNAMDWLALWREVQLYWEHPARGKTFIGSGILEEKSGVTRETVSWRGQNQLEELRRPNTLPGLIFDDIPVSVAIRDLLKLASEGWSAGIEDGLPNTTRRFDGQTALEALLAIIQGIGTHARLNGERRIEVGAFGDDSGLMLTNLPTPARENWANSWVAYIDPPQLTYSGYDIANWIVPLWGNGDQVLTLKRCTRTSPYPVESGTYNDRTVYYLQDAASVAAYGAIQRVLTMKEAPYIGSSGDLINAANVLYDWAAAQLQRKKDPQTTYMISGIKLDKAILPGQKARLRYRGTVTRRDGLPDTWLDIDEDLWVLSVTRNLGADGMRFSLEVSTTDAKPADAVSLLAAMLMSTNLSGVQQRLTSTVNRYSDTLTLSPGSPDSTTFEVSDLAVDLGYSTLKVTRASTSGPDTLDFIFDGETLAGGPYLWGSEAGLTVTVPIDEALLEQSDWHGEHTLEIACQQNSGNLSLVIEITEIGRTI